MKRIALIIVAVTLVTGSVFAVDKYAEDMVEYSDLGGKMEQAMRVLMQHMMEPKVQEAMERME